MASPVLVCVEWNEAAQTCTTTAWMQPPSLLPPLSIQDAFLILGSFLMACVIAWGWGELERVIRQ